MKRTTISGFIIVCGLGAMAIQWSSLNTGPKTQTHEVLNASTAVQSLVIENSKTVLKKVEQAPIAKETQATETAVSEESDVMQLLDVQPITIPIIAGLTQAMVLTPIKKLSPNDDVHPSMMQSTAGELDQPQDGAITSSGNAIFVTPAHPISNDVLQTVSRDTGISVYDMQQAFE